MNKPPPFIAVLTDRYLPYQAEMVGNIAAELNAKGYGVMCITAKELQASTSTNRAHITCNTVYSRVEDYGPQGIIALSGTLGHGVNPNTVSRLLANYNLPKVSVGLNLTDVNSVFFEESSGMQNLMHHLLDNKTRKHFAFLRGHHNDPYSQGREQIFRESLRKGGYGEDNIFYLEGKYDPFIAYQAVTDLLNSGIQVDCVVAANDVMAASAARAAKAHGLNIPTDIAICGFDDSSDSTQHSPALTTVRQPVRKMALDSVKLLLEQIQSLEQQPASARNQTATPPVKRITSNAELVVRRSTNASEPEIVLSTSVDELKIRRLLKNAMYGLDTPDQLSLNTISESLWKTLESGAIDLLSMATQLSDNAIILHAHWWLNMCDQIQSISEQLLAQEYDVANIALVSSAISKIKERIWSLEMDRKFEATRLENDRSEMQLAMSSCNDITDILSATDTWLNKLQPKRCFLIRYNDVGSAPSATAQLIYSFKNGKSEAQHSTYFKSSSVLPPSFIHELTTGLLVFSPVYSDEMLFGYLLLDPCELDLLYIDEAAQCIGNAMRTHYHLTKLQTQKDSLQSVNSELEKLANFDALTGLANRLQFQQYLQTHTEEVSREDNPFALLFIDLDGFKQVNDTLGHGIGDQLLLQVANRLQDCVTSCPEYEGFISRLGGDEFTIILHPTHEAASLDTICQRLLEQVSSPYSINGHEVTISASIGCTLFPDNAINADALVKQADMAMYSAKHNGKNGVALFDPDMDIAANSALEQVQEQQQDNPQPITIKAA